MDTPQSTISAATLTPAICVQLIPGLRGRRPAGKACAEAGMASQRLSLPQ